MQESIKNNQKYPNFEILQNRFSFLDKSNWDMQTTIEKPQKKPQNLLNTPIFRHPKSISTPLKIGHMKK
jgi:hypothetical protein